MKSGIFDSEFLQRRHPVNVVNRVLHFKGRGFFSISYVSMEEKEYPLLTAGERKQKTYTRNFFLKPF